MAAHDLGAPSLSLRQALKDGTQDLHDRLDAMVGASSLACDREYAAFLAAQYAARSPIDAWARTHMEADLRPPPSAHLIAEDLRALSADVPAPVAFAFPADGDAIGVAWALGGSALGNKTMLVRRRRAGASHAESFLRDTATADYFRRLLPRLAQDVPPAAADAAVRGAQAVFASFLTAARHNPLRAAA